MKSPLALAMAVALGLSAPLHAATPAAPADKAAAPVTTNPFFSVSELPYQLPPFDRIRDADYVPAFEQGMKEQLAEIDAITAQKGEPTFDDTILALERSGATLLRVGNVFFNLVGANTNDTMEQIQSDMAPKLAAHQDAIALNGKLFARIKSLHERRNQLGLEAEAIRLIERYHTDFVRAGANLSDSDKIRLKDINAQLAALATDFSQNVLKATNAGAVVVESKARLAGLPEDAIAAAAEAGKERKLEGRYVIALQNTSGQPALASLEDRALRQALQQASVARGFGGEFDNRPVVLKLAKLRAERAALLGYPDFASYALEDQTAKTTTAVNAMLGKLAPAAVANAKREAADMQAIVDQEDGGFRIAAWDWAFYAEKVRQARFDFDESQLRPYFELESVLQNGVFFAATRLYGLTFKERKDLPVYQPDVRTFEVFDHDGKPLGLFLLDWYARDNKRGGAWMNEYVSQNGLTRTRPVVANHLNIPKPPKGEPTLLTFDEVTTAFHEFGHALHGLFSKVKYPRFAGTSVPNDFVEYPSQVNEMWATWPEVLKNYARHYQTGAAMPQALLDKVLATQQFNQGFTTTEYLAAAMLDQRWHQLKPDQIPTDVEAFEAEALKRAGVDFAPVPPRYRTAYFSHIWGGGYSAAYYAYIWSEVLDADSVEWFNEHGGLSRANGDHFRNTLLSRGGSEDAMKLFRDFRGREPDITPLLKRRGLDAPAPK